ncbi:MAG: hypothetical protein ABIH67_03270 [Candidatus Uhrbacteria bacterium]
MPKIKHSLLAVLCLLVAVTLSGCSLLNSSVEDETINEEVATCQTDAECEDDQTCLNNLCQELPCDECQYALEHECLDYECCVNQDCGDQNRSTRDICKGEPRTCSHELITECIPGDYYCPSGCEYDPDTDCEEPSPSAEATGDKEPEETTTIDCGTDLTCFQESLISCSTATYQYDLLGFSYDVTIEEVGNACVIGHVCTDTYDEATAHFKDLYFDCPINKDLLATDVDLYMEAVNNLTTECSGSYVDAMIEWVNQ